MTSDNDQITREVDKSLDDLFGDDEAVQNDISTGVSVEPGKRLDDHHAAAPSAELDNRLDHFFEEESPVISEEPVKKENKSPDPSIQELKSVILSLEWEITDQIMQKLGEEILKLEAACKQDKIVVAFLQLLGSLGKYIRKKKAEAHPDSIRLLQSVYENLEKIMISSDLSETAKKKMLILQVNNYKKLKEEIVVAKISPKEAPPAEPPPKPETSFDEDKKEEPPPPEIKEPKESFEPEEPMIFEETPPDDEFQSEEEYEEDAVGSFDKTDSHQELLQALEAIRKTIQTEFRELRAELKAWRGEQA